MRIRACYSFGQVAQQITSFTLNARVLALRNNRVLISELRYTHKTEEATTKVHKRHKRTKGTNSEKLFMCLLFFVPFVYFYLLLKSSQTSYPRGASRSSWYQPCRPCLSARPVRPALWPLASSRPCTTHSPSPPGSGTSPSL